MSPRVVAVVSLLIAATSFAETPVKPVSEKPVRPAKPVAVVPVAEAPADLPFTLQGFFGTGAGCEAGLRDKASGKSQWVKPGTAYAGWKLESADAKTGRAVLSRDGRRIALRLAGEAPKERVEEPEAEDSEIKEAKEAPNKKTLLDRRAEELMKKNPELKARFEKMMETIEADLKRRRPELFEGKGKGSDEKQMELMLGEASDALGRETMSGSKELATMAGAYSDALKTNPYPEGNDDKVIDEHQERIKTEADRIYRQRTGATE